MSQISECRRILKWTYAFGFYNMTTEDAKKRFFEYTQGEAEQHLERLSEAVEGERELLRFFQAPAPAGEFNEFRGRMAGLTAVTRKFFFTLVSELEEGLPGVDGANVSRTLFGGTGEAVRLFWAKLYFAFFWRFCALLFNARTWRPGGFSGLLVQQTESPRLGLWSL